MNVSLILIFNLLVLAIDTKLEATSGPFRAMILSVQNCEKPSHPYVKDSPISLAAEVYSVSDKMILNCNLTVRREIKNTKLTIKSYVWANNKWRPNYMMNDIGCNGALLQYMTRAVGIKYDAEKCTFLKGHYQMNNLDINAVQHLWAKKMVYGKLMWRGEMFHPRFGTFYCMDFFTRTEPA